MTLATFDFLSFLGHILGMREKNLAILIPAFNEEKTVAKVIGGLPKKLAGIDKIEVVVVDDGSTDRTALLAKKAGAKVLRHKINLGLGGSLGTGLKYARKIRADLAITFDADGQHSPDDIPKIIQPILKQKADVVIGARLQDSKGMPTIKIIGNWIMNLLTYLIYKTWTTDSQSGLRAFSRRALQKISIQSFGYEVSSEIIGQIKEKKLNFKEIPVRAIYSRYSMVKGQNIFNGINIFIRLIFKKILR